MNENDNLKENFCLLFIFEENITKKIQKNFQLFYEKNKEFEFIIVETPNDYFEIGKKDLTLNFEGIKIYYSPKSFLQNNSQQSFSIYQQICNYIDSLYPQKKLDIVDLYSGVGILSLLLSKKGHNVVSIEANKDSLILANKSCLENFLKIDFFSLLVEDSSHLWFKNSIIILNPPRVGISQKVISNILLNRPKLLIYISCMPSTLARDLLKFTNFHYNITSLTVYDMFPQTEHLETVAILERIDNAKNSSI